MGFLLSNAEYFIGLCQKNKISGKLLTLGRQDIWLTEDRFNELLQAKGYGRKTDQGFRYNNKEIAHQVSAIIEQGLKWGRRWVTRDGVNQIPVISDKVFFTSLGFSLIDAVDTNDYEGANLIFDLNEDNIALAISQRYDLVLETGTSEHIFDFPKVLRHMNDLTKVGGFIIHMVPSNNYVDHGFYQFSPTLFLDYYQANKFEILSLEFLRQEIDLQGPAHAMFRLRSYSSQNYVPGMLEQKCIGGLDAALYNVNVCVYKSKESLSGQVPNQSRYERIWQEVKKQ